MRFQDAPLAQKFNPDGDGYDSQTVADSGGLVNEEYESLIDPRTGMILAGKSHENWNNIVDGETELGRALVKLDDNRYYSVEKPKFMDAPVLNDDSDTQDNFAERAKRDYDFSIENNVEFGFGDAVRKEWGTKSGLVKKIPFVGGFASVEENLKMIAAAKRVQDPTLYEQKWGDFVLSSGGATIQDTSALAGIEKEQMVDEWNMNDKEAVSAYLKYVTADKTIMAQIAAGVSVLPTWFLEFAATGGLASLGDDAVQKAGEKILGQYAKTVTGKVAIRASAISAGGITRSIGLGHKVTEGMTQRQLDVVLGLQEEEGWAMSALISWGDVVIEAISESSGDELTKGAGFLLNKTKFGSKVSVALEKTWIIATGGNKGEFVRKMASKGGYSNILAEIGEERLGTLLRAVTDVDDFGAGKEASMIDRLKAGIIQDYENIGVEIGVLSVPFAGQAILGKVANFGKPTDDFTGEFDQTEPIEPEPSPEVVADITTEPTTAQPVAEKGIKTEAKETIVEGEADKKETVQEKPIAIKDGNTDKDMDTIANTLITGKGDEVSTSARQADLQLDREALGLDKIASTERKGWQKSLQQAQDQKVPDNALRIASEINATPRPLNDVETAGLVIKGARLKNEHKSVMNKLSEVTDEAEVASLSSKISTIEGEFDNISSALHKSGSEKGRALAAQKLTINQDFDLLSLKNRAKARKGKPLTEKETKKIEQLSKDLELVSKQNDVLQKKIEDLLARDVIKVGSVSRFSGLPRAKIESELDSLISRTRQLLDEGCYN